jgi:hypothetical protein
MWVYKEGKEPTLCSLTDIKRKKAGTLPPLDLRACQEITTRNSPPKYAMPLSDRLPKIPSSSLLLGPQGLRRRLGNAYGQPLRLRDLHETARQPNLDRKALGVPRQSHSPQEKPLQRLFPSIEPPLKMVISQRQFPAPSGSLTSLSFLRLKEDKVTGDLSGPGYRFN